MEDSSSWRNSLRQYSNVERLHPFGGERERFSPVRATFAHHWHAELCSCIPNQTTEASSPLGEKVKLR